ncbi:MAG: DUF1294 domain-containing protein [Planctomycetota bacterium]|jgi:uncharacterized membrane protein YsdA (DUF1294 family)
MRQFLLAAGSLAILASLVSFILYGFDKRRARRDGQRVPEKRLHVLALLGGWPGAMLGQRLFRHKTVKVQFRIVFWLTVACHVVIVSGVSWLLWS